MVVECPMNSQGVLLAEYVPSTVGQSRERGETRRFAGEFNYSAGAVQEPANSCKGQALFLARFSICTVRFSAV